jgi:hypothetical protein
MQNRYWEFCFCSMIPTKRRISWNGCCSVKIAFVVSVTFEWKWVFGCRKFATKPICGRRRWWRKKPFGPPYVIRIYHHFDSCFANVFAISMDDGFSALGGGWQIRCAGVDPSRQPLVEIFCTIDDGGNFWWAFNRVASWMYNDTVEL